MPTQKIYRLALCLREMFLCVTSEEKKPYVIAASPIAGYRVIREYSWAIPLTSFKPKVYVLEQLSQTSKNKD